MDELLGISGDVTPEKRFLYHRAHIHKEDQELFEEYAAKLAKEPTEIVYRFIHPITGDVCPLWRKERVRQRGYGSHRWHSSGYLRYRSAGKE